MICFLAGDASGARRFGELAGEQDGAAGAAADAFEGFAGFGEIGAGFSDRPVVDVLGEADPEGDQLGGRVFQDLHVDGHERMKNTFGPSGSSGSRNFVLWTGVGSAVAAEPELRF